MVSTRMKINSVGQLTIKLTLLYYKNTGHNFVGRSTGAGSLSIWTHHLKSFEFLPGYTQGEYYSMAARVGSGEFVLDSKDGR